MRESLKTGVPRSQLCDYWVDLSQSVARRPWGNKLRPFRPMAQIYSFEMGRCLDGLDAMRLLGWPESFLSGLSPSDLLALSAEGSAPLPLAALVESVMHSNPYGSWHCYPRQSPL